MFRYEYCTFRSKVLKNIFTYDSIYKGEGYKKIEFSKLYELDYNLSDLFAMQQFWKENATFKMSMPRRTSCLLYFSGCSAIYKYNGSEELSVARGSVLYIPEDAVYGTRFFDCDADIPAYDTY